MKTPMGEMPATGKKVGMQVAHAVHFTDDGKTADKEWFYQDNGELMGQLGVSKAPARAMVDKPFQEQRDRRREGRRHREAQPREREQGHRGVQQATTARR